MGLEGQSPFRPIPQQTLSQSVGEQLRAAIRSGTLSPGMRLVERDISQKLDVSRIPVREAIQRLVEEGLVIKTPHRGAFVYAPTAKEIEEIASLRIVLERFVMERVITCWQPHHAQELRAIVRDMLRAAGEARRQRVFELDALYHRTLWQIADHEILSEVVSGLRARISRFLYESTMALSPSGLADHVNGHEPLIDMLESGQVAVAKEFITEHILAAKDRIYRTTSVGARDDTVATF
jgi:DNA-binding GntR family transcriptional regulator